MGDVNLFYMLPIARSWRQLIKISIIYKADLRNICTYVYNKISGYTHTLETTLKHL